MATSVDSFHQVSFNGIQESYLRVKDLNCEFTLSPSLTPSAEDRIAILRVGWKSLQEVISYKNVIIPEDTVSESGLQASVVFSAADLPEDTEDFYQFAYISQADQRLRGISTPFQCVNDQSAIDWELVNTEEPTSLNDIQASLQPEPSIVIVDENQPSEVRNVEKTTDEVRLLQEQLDSLKKKLNIKQEELIAVTRERDQFEEKLKLQNDRETSHNDVQQRYLDLETKFQHMAFSLQAKEEQLKTLQEQIKSKDESSDVKEAPNAQKTNEDSQIAELKCQLHQKENEWKAKEEFMSAALRNMQEQLESAKAKNADLELQIQSMTVNMQLMLSATSLNKAGGEIKNSEGDPTECPVCQIVFAPGDAVQVREAHVMAHIERVCPVCDGKFSPDDESGFSRHVEECLSNRVTR